MKERPIELINQQNSDLERQRNIPDDEIDTSGALDILDSSKARRGMFYRSDKPRVILGLDAEVISWFEEHAAEDERGFQVESRFHTPGMGETCGGTNRDSCAKPTDS